MRQLVVLLANIYGLVIVILMMGYGLVDIPRYLLRKADRQGWLKHYMIQVSPAFYFPPPLRDMHIIVLVSSIIRI